MVKPFEYEMAIKKKKKLYENKIRGKRWKGIDSSALNFGQWMLCGYKGYE